MGRHRSRSSRRRFTLLATIAAAALLALTGAWATTTANADPARLLDASATPAVAVDPDPNAVELGVRFSASTAGEISAIRFYKTPSNAGPHTAALWDSRGKLLARASFSDETASGWQTATLDQPIKISAGRSYTASYTVPHGHYAVTENAFTRATRNGQLSIPARGGVYTYSPGRYPTQSYRASNYFVDVSFLADGSGSPTTPPPSTAPASPASTPAPSTTATPPPSSTPTPTPTDGDGQLKPGSHVTVRQLDGGLGYYDQFANGLPSSPDYFPVGVWLESIIQPGDVKTDQAAGINTYVDLTASSDPSIAATLGSYSLTDIPSAVANGYVTTDEADMWTGPGSAPWTGAYPGQGALCLPESAQCGYSVIDTLKRDAPTGSMTYANYGKGIAFWENAAQAKPFVDAVDLVSDDLYWFTDPGICGATTGGWGPGTGVALTDAQCRLAANYGWTIDKVRSLTGGDKPVWGFVEDGHPFTEDDSATITGPQLRAAVWSSIIHGARGIIYFNHDFGGSCISQHVLRDSCGTAIRPTVTAVDAQIAQLAPVLNSPFLDGLVSASGTVDTMAKVYGGSTYIFAGSAQQGAQTVSITSRCGAGTTAEVLGENRSLPVSNGVFTDTFADGNAVHIYRVDASCGL